MASVIKRIEAAKAKVKPPEEEKEEAPEEEEEQEEMSPMTKDLPGMFVSSVVEERMKYEATGERPETRLIPHIQLDIMVKAYESDLRDSIAAVQANNLANASKKAEMVTPLYSLLRSSGRATRWPLAAGPCLVPGPAGCGSGGTALIGNAKESPHQQHVNALKGPSEPAFTGPTCTQQLCEPEP